MSKQLDLLLVNPSGRQQVYQGLHDSGLTSVETPVWCGLIACFVRKHGFTVEIADFNAGICPVGDPKLTAVVCYGQQPSASTQTMPAAIDTCKKLKALGHKVIMVGGHVAALPDRTLEESGADYVATGEGCHTILDLLRGKQPQDCRGLGYKARVAPRDDGGYSTGDIFAAYYETHDAPNVEDVNDLEMTWDLLPPERYRAHNWQCLGNWPRTPYAALYTSLGCPFSCSFCCIQAPFKGGDQLLQLSRKPGGAGNFGKEGGNSYRLWKPDSVGEQVAKLYYEHGCKTYKVADEMFVLNRRHVEGVCDAIISRIKDPADVLNIWAYARVDTANDVKLLEKMRSAGFRWLCLGIESASAKVRDGVDKGYAQEKIAKCCERIKSAGIHVLANYIFGLPEDMLESMQATLDMAVELNTPWANFYSAMPYPGSKLWDESPSHHALPWEAFSQHSRETHPLATRTLSSAQVLEFRDRAFTTYFTGERYRSLVFDTFGADALTEVERMVSHKLRRSLLEEQHALCAGNS